MNPMTKIDDAISRKSAVNTVMSLYNKCDTLSMNDYRDMLIGALEVLPPSHPDWNELLVKCDNCGRMMHVKVGGEQDEADRC